jgi:hypothetical protein
VNKLSFKFVVAFNATAHWHHHVDTLSDPTLFVDANDGNDGDVANTSGADGVGEVDSKGDSKAVVDSQDKVVVDSLDVVRLGRVSPQMLCATPSMHVIGNCDPFVAQSCANVRFFDAPLVVTHAQVGAITLGSVHAQSLLAYSIQHSLVYSFLSSFHPFLPGPPADQALTFLFLSFLLPPFLTRATGRCHRRAAPTQSFLAHSIKHSLFFFFISYQGHRPLPSTRGADKGAERDAIVRAFRTFAETHAGQA